MDIADLSPIEHTFELKHPAKETGLGIFLTTQSMQSEDVQAVERRIRNEALRLRARGKTFKAEDIDANTKHLLVAAITKWDWKNSDMSLNGVKNPEFNVKNLKALLDIPWVIPQIDNELEDTKNFFKD